MKIRNTNCIGKILLLLALLPAGTAIAVDQAVLHALFKDKAILVVDGKRRVLQVGETSPDGVKLVATNTQDELAVVEVGSERRELKLGMVMSSFTMASRGSVTLYPGGGGHFFADGVINGAGVRFLVDTGATMVALSGMEAQRLGIDYKKHGRPGYASTAGGVVRTYSLTLDAVQVGAITLYNIEAGVIEGSHPSPALLGMSFLGRLDMKRDNQKLELIQR